MEYSDGEIIEQLQNNPTSYEDISAFLFRQYLGYIPTLQSKFKISKEQLQDCYADALVAFLQNIKRNRFKGGSKLSTYFYSIFQYKVVDVFRKQTTNTNIETVEIKHDLDYVGDLKDQLEIKDAFENLHNQMNLMKGNCKAILLDWGYYGYSMDEIAARHNLSSAESARSMKYKCLKSLKALLNKNVKS